MQTTNTQDQTTRLKLIKDALKQFDDYDLLVEALEEKRIARVASIKADIQNLTTLLDKYEPKSIDPAPRPGKSRDREPITADRVLAHIPPKPGYITKPDLRKAMGLSKSSQKFDIWMKNEAAKAGLHVDHNRNPHKVSFA